ncbi:hypothetical protein BU16DRAFT_534567 [Lophium mytilinum]|uniref:Heterokaryon incompatibility domain-containing protein n=1 Tax=Lophium mytilinum TaxID=390894 RepID=A0A6A6R6A2_9PEZI|nr:hypothetical protein BU16DRAFT_534567 [Lophium mytilinum]
MDFMPQPPGGVLAPIEVPLAESIVPYERLGTFALFPTHCGFAIERGQVDFQCDNTQKVASLLQSWLYFGLISEFLGYTFDHREFTKQKSLPDGSTVTIVETKRLWSPSLLAGLNMSSSDRTWRFWLTLEIAGEHILRADTQIALESPLATITLSIKVLMYALSVYMFPKHQHPSSVIPALDPSNSASKLSPATRFLITRMTDAGWCPFQAFHLCSRHHIAVVYYLSQLHRRYRPELTHSRCTRNSCIANNIDMDTYPTKHVCSKCRCSAQEGNSLGPPRPMDCGRCQCSQFPVRVDVERLRQIIQEGGVPLISITEHPQGLRLEVEKLEATSSYVAISHVWSDGMGNPTDNALPQCVLRRIHRSLDRLPPSSKEHPSRWLTGLVALSVHMARRSGFRMGSRKKLFWMDTLCIPVGHEYADLRSKAINQMALIYAAASQVLVLDSELQELRMGASQESEILGHILCCAWNTRCWTLQEGELARSRRFQLGDGIFDLDTGPPSYRDMYYGRVSAMTMILRILPSEFSHWARESLKETRSLLWSRHKGRRKRPLPKLVADRVNLDLRTKVQESFSRSFWERGSRDFSGLAKPDAFYEQFLSVWNTLRFRTTTKRDDLCLILANLLDLNSYALIHQASHEKKMKTFLWSVGPKLPVSLLYNTGPRSRCGQDHANRWVPTEPSASHLNQPSMELTEDSLSLSSRDHALNESTLLYVNMSMDIRFRNIVIRDLITGIQYRVEIYRKEDDSIDFGKYASFCVLIERTFCKDAVPQCGDIRGACLLTDWTPEIHRASNALPVLMNARYDCPLKLQVCDSLNTHVGQVDEYHVLGQSILGPWQLHIDAGS